MRIKVVSLSALFFLFFLVLRTIPYYIMYKSSSDAWVPIIQQICVVYYPIY
jgi:hypothetical protein